MTIFQEKPGSPEETWTTTGVSAQRMLQCDWADRYSLAQALMSTVYPYSTAFFPNVTPQNVRIHGLGKCMIDGNGLTYYPKAIIEATYEYKAVDATLGGNWERRDNFKVEHITLEKERLYWETHGGEFPPVALNKPMVRIEPSMESAFTRKNCPQVPRAMFNAKKGLLNSDTFLGYAPYFVLFLGGDGTQAQGLPGVCTLKFLIGSHDLRKGWREDIGAYAFVYTGPFGGTTPIYTATTFAELIADGSYA